MNDATDDGGTLGTPTVDGAPAKPQSILRRLWTSEVGVKTVHFWYDLFKLRNVSLLHLF